MEAYALTDIGRVRSMNQDYIYASQETIGSLPNLFLVADGMGGHQPVILPPGMQWNIWWCT